jgi:Cd2+/Zn2+-exporting ATPase
VQELIRDRRFRWLVVSLVIIVPFEVLSFFSFHFPLWIELPLFLGMIVVFGRKVFTSGIWSLLRLNFANINLLMTIAAAGAIYLRQFEEAVIIIVLFALGDTLEEFGIKRSQIALKELIAKTPTSAQKKGEPGKTPIEDIQIGDILVIKPGDQIPLDGEVVEGSSLVDEASITGEPLPKNKRTGDPVYAGTLNGQGFILVRVTKKVKETTLAKIIELTYQAAEKKSKSHRFIEQFAKIYTPAMTLAAVLVVIIPVVIFGKPFNLWFRQALTLLIIACPCALVISTPVAIFSAIGNATRKGVLIKGGRFIEEMGRVRAIAFDKTRTLTKGEPVVADIVPFNGFSEEDVIACAAGLETFSEHPLARSILKRAAGAQVQPHRYENFQAVSGKGVKGECTVCFDSHHCLGSIGFVTEEHPIEKAVLERVREFEAQGKTTIVISDNKRVNGIISVSDEIRSESKPMVESLVGLKITPVILTGDNAPSAHFIAQKVGIGIVNAELLPDIKVAELLKLIGQYKHVAMVGDGINDAPALASASVGIALGAVGSGVAIENADIALMNDNLMLVPYLVRLGRRAVGTIRFNIIVAVAVKFLFMALAVGGVSNLALAIFADVGISVLVILNSLRLYGGRDTDLK